jgi:hypothetical protein
MKGILFNTVALLVLLLTACSVKQDRTVIQFEGSFSEKKWALKDLNPEIPADWTPYGFLTFEFNASTPQRFELILYDAEGIRKLEILPFQGAWVSASIPLVHFQKMNTKGMDQASIWKTPRPGYWIGFTNRVGSVSHIDSLGIAMNQPVGYQTLEIRNIRLTMTPQDSILVTQPLVDEFGQWITAEWTGKAKTLDDLKTAWSLEEKILQSESILVSKYGGFPDTKAKRTGFFHVKKIDGKWWFVDPDGHLFFSNGSCCIEPRSDLSRVRGREYLFTRIPPAIENSDPDQPAGNDHNSSFYTWNLVRRFSTDWYRKWMDLTIQRMNSWGINTIGNWSDAGLANSNRIAFVATLDGWGIENGMMGMPDVYAPDYAVNVDAAAKQQCLPHKGDAFLLGYFIGNEPPWPGRETELTNLILAGEKSSMQTALKNYLVSGDTPERRRAFVYETYSKFVGTVCSAIRKYDPNHLNLGFRFSDPPSDEIIKISKQYFDVFSINHYGYTTDPAAIQRIYELTGLPVMIGEFHFGTPGRGLAPGLVQTKNPEERGIAYRYYVENAAAHPAVIGSHWFQWIDQPTTGRFDGENYNIGFVDVTDRPYPDLVNAVKETYNRLLDIHSGKVPPVTRQALVQ